MDLKQYKAKVNDHLELDVHVDHLENLDAVDIQNGQLHIIKEGRTYVAEVVESDFHKKSFLIEINGNAYTVALADAFDQLVKQLGLSITAGRKISEIPAPMPGLVLEIIVKPGQEVQEGDPLLILEAMKMENILKAPGEGVIGSVEVEKGQAVDKGQLLIRMD
jgi:biotin carboxyl carrier protein